MRARARDDVLWLHGKLHAGLAHFRTVITSYDSPHQSGGVAEAAASALLMKHSSLASTQESQINGAFSECLPTKSATDLPSFLIAAHSSRPREELTHHFLLVRMPKRVRVAAGKRVTVWLAAKILLPRCGSQMGSIYCLASHSQPPSPYWEVSIYIETVPRARYSP